ncbi:MAG: DUF4430 domain-containing protein [Candidatus Bathyarchaeia archaeon]
MSKKGYWMWSSLGLLCLLIIAVYLAAYYYSESIHYKTLYERAAADLRKLTMKVNILIDYGNGTLVWYNGTMVPKEASVLMATKVVAAVEGTEYPDMGTFVDSINGVRNESGRYWIWYIWNQDKREWEWGPVASNKYILHEDDIIMWKYEKF